ncbi:MAG: hypothetical protein SPL08_03515 [Pseudomonadota bacterium]|nr:hypothetical protein [Pseudomonadota bacterium]
MKSFMLCFVLMIGTALAQPLSDDTCEQLLLKSEENHDVTLYDDCGFGDEARAWNHWAPFVAAHELKRGIFELCQRYPLHAYGELYCNKAVDMNFGPALAMRGRERLRTDNAKEALYYFNQALKSGDLTEDEKVKITETLGTIYLNKQSPEYAPDAGIDLLNKAANNRSAMANNALAYLSFSGDHKIKRDHKKALFLLWKSILLGCPAAEENLGAYHLAKQGRISEDDAKYYMSLQAFTCEPFDKNIKDDAPVGCKCKDIQEHERYLRSQPYIFLGIQDQKALIRNKIGESFTYSKGEITSDGFMIQDISSTLVTLIKNGKKSFLNRYHQGRCVDYCLKNANKPKKRKPVRIRPYHLTFTPEECININYYAPKVIDTTLPYIGKKECHKTVDGAANY